jgi:hypothetical protein
VSILIQWLLMESMDMDPMFADELLKQLPHPPVVRNKKGIEWDDLLADFESAKYDQWLLNDPSHHQIGPVVARKCIDIDTM